MAFLPPVLGLCHAPAWCAVPRPRAGRRLLVVGGHAVETIGYSVAAPVHLHDVARATVEDMIAVVQSGGSTMRHILPVAGKCMVQVFFHYEPTTALFADRYVYATDAGDSVSLRTSPVPVVGVGVSAIFLTVSRDGLGQPDHVCHETSLSGSMAGSAPLSKAGPATPRPPHVERPEPSVRRAISVPERAVNRGHKRTVREIANVR